MSFPRYQGETPAVSVLIPTFQRRELLRRAVGSVVAQTYRDFEVIVIDDGSTDGTGEMLESLDTRGLRFHYRWQPNRGVAAARNVGLELARGEIIAFLDSDNLWLTDHLDVVVEVFRRQPEAVLVSTCPRFILAGRQQAADAALMDYRSAEAPVGRDLLGDPKSGLLEAAGVGFLSCIAVCAEAIRQAGGLDERLAAMEDSDLLRRLATLGPFATVRRRTVLAQATSGSLRDRAATSGRYLKAAEHSAENLTTAVGRMPEADRRRLEDQPRHVLHLARAMRALDRRDETTLRAELEIACETYPLSTGLIGSRLRHHLPRSGQPLERLAMLETLTRVWPQPHAHTSRYLRAWAIGLALRLGRPGQALRMLRGWQWRGTARFGRRVAPSLWYRARCRWQARRYRGRETDELASSQPSSPP